MWKRKYFFGGWFCFDESVADARLGQTVIQVVLQNVVGYTANKAILSKISPAHEAVKGLWWLLFLDWSSKDGIKEKRRGLLQCFVDDV